ncbi:LysM peptidoglycan-binding domain-containing protein [Nocardioidaceae bacterium SCSIO 66511]|nr:LysM peptidoglycan-binding domain-containing protein [Nocardioidaceae bacterium SCSIO 66511]
MKSWTLSVASRTVVHVFDRTHVRPPLTSPEAPMTTADLHLSRPAPVTTARRAAGRGVEGPLRLTRRGRVVVVVTALLVVLGGLVAFGPSVVATKDAAPEPVTVTVHPGETLWEIAGRVNPDGDVRSTVDDLSELNGITDAGALRMGTELKVPRY